MHYGKQYMGNAIYTIQHTIRNNDNPYNNQSYNDALY